MGSELWLQIDISRAGAELRAAARSSRGEEPPPHTLGPQLPPEALGRFGEWVKEAASKGMPLTPLTGSQQLFQALIQQGLQQVLHQLQGTAKGESILLRLNASAPELQAVPWEALCRPETTVDFLGTSQQISLVRGASSLKPWESCRIQDSVRLLVISPSDESAPDRLRAVLHPSLEAGELAWIPPLTGAHATETYVLNRLRYPPAPHVLHFIGHGGLDAAGHPTLRLADRNGQESWLKVELLAKELEPLARDTLRLVVLEACEGARPGTLASAAAWLAQAGVGAVVAHLWPVRADVARRCSVVLYRSLTGTAAHRGDVARSLHDARRALLAEFQESAEAFSPVLYLRGHEPVLFDFRGRKRPAPGVLAQTAAGDPVEPAARALRELLRQPCCLLLGEHGSSGSESFRQTLHAGLQGTPHASPDTLPLSALAQRYALQFGDEALNNEFQTAFVDSMPSAPLMDALARRLGPGVHITLLRAPLLEEALARHHPSRPLYVLQPSRSDNRSVVTLLHTREQGWVKLKKPPDTFDPEREAVVVRFYRGYLPNGAFDVPLLTEDDFLLHVRRLEDALPPALAIPLKSVLARRPALMLGLSLLPWDHRHLLYSLFGRRPLPEGSSVLLEPGAPEADAWRSGQGLPGGAPAGGLQRIVQAPYLRAGPGARRARRRCVSGNPFLGAQPYRAAEQDRFFGREVVTGQLASHVLANPCVTLFGESGVGKSSLMQAGVIPYLEKAHRFRTVRIDGWLLDELPLRRLAQALFMSLELGPAPQAMEDPECIELAVDLAMQQSSRPVLIYLDQLEQLFLPERDAQHVEALLDGLDALARKPIRGLQLVLSLREDYLGRFRERARGHRELLEQGFRLGPLTVGEMAKVACQIAGQGAPSQRWSEDSLRELMLQVRVAGQGATEHAEVQAAFAQIVCRALWEEPQRMKAVGPVLAEPLLHRYLEATLEGLGPRKEHARRLLLEHLIDRDGRRMLLMEPTARKALSGLSDVEASEVLRHLEDAAVLHAEAHQGSRYFELGHDWLARKVFEFRQEREQAAARKLQAEQAARRRQAILAGASFVLAVSMGLLSLWALSERRAAQQALTETQQAHERTFYQAMVLSARELLASPRRAVIPGLLLEVTDPGQIRGWGELALDVLATPVPNVTLRCHGKGDVFSSFSRDGKHVAVACPDQTVQVWNVDGTGSPIVRGSYEETNTSVIAFSPDGDLVVTASFDGRVRVWKVDGTAPIVVLRGHEDVISSAAFSLDGRRIVTTSLDKTARVWNADGTGQAVILRGHEGVIHSGAFSPDGRRIVTASSDKTARVWNADGSGEAIVLSGHEDTIISAAFSPDGLRILTASWDKNSAGVEGGWQRPGCGPSRP